MTTTTIAGRARQLAAGVQSGRLVDHGDAAYMNGDVLGSQIRHQARAQSTRNQHATIRQGFEQRGM
jgi:hypothetical protein